MAIKTQSRSIVTTVDPLSLHYGISILSGNSVQTYNNDTKEYEPDRNLVPLIVMPYVEAYDPEGVQNGAQTLTGVEWYDGVPAADYSNRITADGNYETGTGTSGFPTGALKVKKNIPADKPMQLFCVTNFDDKRTGRTVKLEMCIKLYTTVYESKNYKVTLDCPASWKINPLDETTWKHTITAQLYSGSTAVDDAHVAYWWKVKEDGDDEWRDITTDDENTWLTCKSGGVTVRTLTFDARKIKSASFKVTAAYYEGSRPATATDASITDETTVDVSMPPSLTVEQIQTKGARMSYDFSTEVGFKVLIRTNRSTVTDEQTSSLFKIQWKGQSTGGSAVSLGTGREISFVPKSKGFDPSKTLKVWAEVSMYAYSTVKAGTGGAEPTFTPVYE